MTTRIHLSPRLVLPPRVLVFTRLVREVDVAVRARVKVLLRVVRQLVVLERLRVGGVELARGPVSALQELL